MINELQMTQCPKLIVFCHLPARVKEKIRIAEKLPDARRAQAPAEAYLYDTPHKQEQRATQQMGAYPLFRGNIPPSDIYKAVVQSPQSEVNNP
jgi:hypothetical protein